MISLQFNTLFNAVKDLLSETMGNSHADSVTLPYSSPTGKMERAKITKRLNGYNYTITIERKKIR